VTNDTLDPYEIYELISGDMRSEDNRTDLEEFEDNGHNSPRRIDRVDLDQAGRQGVVLSKCVINSLQSIEAD
jgi:hypothetical protein